MLEGSNEEFINLNDDSLDNFTTLRPQNDAKVSDKTTGQILPTSTASLSDLLKEEIDTRNLPASPPFTKVSSIKMYKTTPLKPGKTEIVELKPVKTKESNLPLKRAKDSTKSFLPRIVKKRPQ